MSTRSRRTRRQPRRRKRLPSRLQAARQMSFLMMPCQAVSSSKSQALLCVPNVRCFRTHTSQDPASCALYTVLAKAAKQMQHSSHVAHVPVSQPVVPSRFHIATRCIQSLLSPLEECLEGFVQAAPQATLQAVTACHTLLAARAQQTQAHLTVNPHSRLMMAGRYSSAAGALQHQFQTSIALTVAIAA